MIALIGFSWRSVRRGRQQSILFLIAVLILFLGALEYVLNINGWITYLFLFNSTIPSNLQIFIIIEVVLVFIAIAFRFKKIRDENLDYKYQLLLSESRKKDEAIALILQERKRISSELHDGVGSILFGVRMKVHSVFKRMIGGEDEFISLNQDLDLMSESLRKVVWRLQDHGHFGNLVELIVGKAEDQLKKLNKIFQTEISIDSSIEVSDDFSRDFYFLFSEILSNTLKYSTAEKIVCQIVIDGDMIRFKWEDAGRVNQIENTIGMGLQSIQNRISRWQGVIEPGNNRFDYQINFPISAIVKNESE
jgi:signal transduction histidine kinase